jgi:aldehyde dehydrogenase (NAD+)
VMIPYESEAEAVSIANASEYGLAGYVSSGNIERARRVARQLRAGSIFVNCPEFDVRAPFGGYKRSGNGREAGVYGLTEYLEVKSIVGHG